MIIETSLNLKNKNKEELMLLLNESLGVIEKLQKENEELRAKWDKDTHILQNKLDYANADRIDLAQQNKESRKENEKLNNRCRNLDKEAQAYLEELAGDNTLTRRTIKQLQEENEELKYKIKGQECVIETQVHNEEVYESIFEKLEKENKELKKQVLDHHFHQLMG